MKILRNLALACTFAVAAFSGGAANAAPVPTVELNLPAATESAVTPAYHFGGHHHGRRLCHVPFFKLVQWYGYWQARMIKRRCHYSGFYGYYGYYGYNYGGY